MVSAMVGEKAAKDLILVSLSNYTAKKRIHKISDNVKEQLIERIYKSQNYSLQVDENTDLGNNLICCVPLDTSLRKKLLNIYCYAAL
jgi:hypothetical protein